MINTKLVNGLNLDPTGSSESDYWSSTEQTSTKSYIYKFKDGHIKNEDKTKKYRVRAVRSF